MAAKFPSELNVATNSADRDLLVIQKDGESEVKAIAVEDVRVTNAVIINELADLPTPSLGVITLVPGAYYQFSGNVDIGSNRLEITGDTTIFGINLFNDLIISTTTGPLITVTAGNVQFQSIGFSCPNATVCEGNIGGGPTASVAFDFCFVKDCVKLMTSNGLNNTFVQEVQVVSCTGSPMIDFLADQSAFFCLGCFFEGYAGTVIDLGSNAFNVVKIKDNQMTGTNPANITIDGLIDSGNINAGGFGIFISNVLAGPFVDINNIDPGDLLWTIKGNEGQRQSKVSGTAEIDSNAVETVTNTSSFVTIAGTATLNPLSQRFILSGDNGLEAQNRSPDTGTATVSLSASRSGGGTSTYEFQIHKNGTAQGVPFEIELRSVSDALSFTTAVDITDGDIYDVRVLRISGTTNILVSDLSLTIKE